MKQALLLAVVFLLAVALLMPTQLASAQGRPPGPGPDPDAPDGPMGPPPPPGPGMHPPHGPGMPPPPPPPGMPPPPGGPGMPPPPGTEMPPEGWEPGSDLLALVQKEDPEFWQDVEKLQRADEDRFTTEIFRWKNRRDRLQALRQQDPERAKLIERIDLLERQIHILAEQIHRSQEPATAASREKLLSLLSELFDRREEDRRNDIARLEKRLTDLKGSVQDRRAHKDDIVKRRLSELLGGEDALRW